MRTLEPTPHLTPQSTPALTPALYSALGPLAAFLTTPHLTDLILGPRGTMWIDTSDAPGLRLAHHGTLPEDTCRAIAVNALRLAGSRLDDAHPWADGSLHLGADTLRLHAVLAPLAHNGTTLSLRILRPHQHNLRRLENTGMLTPQQCTQLVKLVATRRSLIISGATGVGKTTLLGALVSTIPSQERVVCIEDTPELSLPHPQLVRLVTRHANTEGVGEIPMSVLVRQTLRMRPDRIIVGEVRGPEVVDLLSALSTGHQGGLTSLHANNASEVPERLTSLALAAGMPHAAIRSTITHAFGGVVNLSRHPHTGQRHVDTITTWKPTP